MASLKEIRAQYPQYDDMSDRQLADALHAKFYPDLAKEKVYQTLGVLDDQQSSALAAGKERAAQMAAGTYKPPFNAGVEADRIESVRGTGAFAAATDSSFRGIPFSDELSSALNAPFLAGISYMRGDGFDVGREYNQAMDVEEELRRREDRHPIASLVGEVAGGLGVGGAAKKAGVTLLQGAKPTFVSLAGRGAAEGAGYGLVYGAGEGRGLAERGYNAVVGAGTGATIGGATGALTRIGAARIPDDAVPSMDALRQAGDAAYKRADAAGVMFTPQALERLHSGLVTDFADFGFHPTNQPAAAAVLNQIGALRGGNVTLKGLDTIRKMAGKAYIQGNRANNELTSRITNHIDDLVASPAANDVLVGDPQAGAAALGEARDMWSRLRKAESLNTAVERAELRAASTGSGGNVDNATRQNVRRLLEKERGFSPTERQALETVARGTPTQNAARLVGKLAPTGIVSGGMGTSAGASIGSFIGGPVGAGIGAAVVPAVGQTAKVFADGLTGRYADIARIVIRNGGVMPAVQMAPGRRAIADVLSRTSGQQLPGYIDR